MQESNYIETTKNLLKTLIQKNEEKSISSFKSEINSKLDDSVVENLQTFMENLALKQKDRHVKQIVFVFDGRDIELGTEESNKYVTVIRAPMMNLDNTLNILQELDILGKGSLIIIVCGIYSLIKSKTIDICKKMNCQNRLIKYSINLEMSSDALISKALHLHEYILDNSPSDKVMFCDIIPQNIFKNVTQRCSNNHIYKNTISNDLYIKYFKIIDNYNSFVENHARIMGFKYWNMMSNSYPTHENVTSSSTSYCDINNIINRRASDCIIKNTKEILNSFEQSTEEEILAVLKTENEAKVVNDSVIENIQTFLETLDQKQKKREVKQIILVLDDRSLELNTEFSENVKVIKEINLNFDNALNILQKLDALGKGSLFIFVCGIYSLINSKVVSICKSLNCENKLINYSVISEISSNLLISKALNLHQYILDNSTNDQVMFCDIIPANICNGTVQKCSNNHALRNDISNDLYVKYLKIIDEYNAFVEEHSRTMGYKNWYLLNNSLPSEDCVNRTLKSYDFGKIGNEQLANYIIEKTIELLRILNLPVKEKTSVVGNTLKVTIEEKYTSVKEIASVAGNTVKVSIEEKSTPVQEIGSVVGDTMKMPLDDKSTPVKEITSVAGNILKVSMEEKSTSVKAASIVDNTLKVSIEEKSTPVKVIASLVRNTLKVPIEEKSTKVKEIASLAGNTLKAPIKEKSTEDSSSTKEIQFLEKISPNATFFPLIKFLEQKQRGRFPHQIVLAVDNDNFDLKFKFSDCITVKTVEEFKSASESLKDFVGKDSLFVVLFGRNSLIHKEIVEECKIKKCPNPLTKYSINKNITNIILISKALFFHKLVIKNAKNDKVMFTELIPHVFRNGAVKRCSNGHEIIDVTTEQEYSNYLKVIEDYNDFVKYHSRIMGYQHWKILFNSYPFDDNITYNMKLNYDYSKVNNRQISEYIVRCTEDLLQNISTKQEEPSKDSNSSNSDTMSEDNIAISNVSLESKENVSTFDVTSKSSKRDLMADVQPICFQNNLITSKVSSKLQKYPLISDITAFAEDLAERQNRRCPSQIVFVVDDRESYFIRRDKLGDNIKVFGTDNLNFENAIEYFEESKALGKNSLLIFMCGINSLLISSFTDICRKMNCSNQVANLSVRGSVSSVSLINKALRLHEYVLSTTTNDQVMFCELIPKSLLPNDKVCGNKHSQRLEVPQYLYKYYLKTVEEYNIFVEDHCRIFGFKKWNLLSNSFPVQDKIDNYLSCSYDYDVIDTDLASNYVTESAKELLDILRLKCEKKKLQGEQVSNIIEVPKDSKLQTLSKNLIEEVQIIDVEEPPHKRLKTDVEVHVEAESSVAIISDDGEKKTTDGSKLFEEVVIILSENYAKQKDIFRKYRVNCIVIGDTSKFDYLLAQIKCEVRLHSERTLYLLYTGIFDVAHREKYNDCKCFRSPFSPSLSVIVADQECPEQCVKSIDSAVISFEKLINVVNSQLKSGSFFCVLPPSPPIFLNTDSTSFHSPFHNLHSVKEQIEWYFSTYKDINNLKITFTRYSKAVTSLAISESSKFGVSNEMLKQYDNVTSKWDHHITSFSYLSFISEDNDCFGVKYKLWLKAINDFINNCIDDQDASKLISAHHTDDKLMLEKSIQKCSKNNSNNSLASIPKTKSNTSVTNVANPVARTVDSYDQLIFISCCQKQIDLLPVEEENSSCISAVYVKTFDWIDVEKKLDSMKSLATCKKNLFVILGGIMLLEKEFKLYSCIQKKCGEELTYLSSGTLPEEKLAIEVRIRLSSFLNKIQKKFDKRTNILIIPLPTICAEIENIKNIDHEKLHELLRNKNSPYLVLGGKDRWNVVAKQLNMFLEMKMHIRFYEVKKLQFLMPEILSLSRAISLVQWTDLEKFSEDLAFNIFKKYKTFLEKLVTTAIPCIKFKPSCTKSITSSSEVCLTGETSQNKTEPSLTTKKFQKYSDLNMPQKGEENYISYEEFSDEKSANVASAKIVTSNTSNISAIPKKKSAAKTNSVNEFSKFVIDMTKVKKQNDQIPFNHVYIVGKSGLSSLLNLNLENVEFIQCKQSEVAESEVPTLVKKFGTIKLNSVCFLTLDLLYFANENNVSPSCRKFNCKNSSPILNLDIEGDFDRMTITSYVLNKIMNLISFVTKMSLHLPIIIMPFFPARLYSHNGLFYTMHKLSHAINKTDSYVIDGKFKKWQTFDSVTSNLWMNIMKSNNDKFFLAEDFHIYMKENNKNLIYENNFEKYSSLCSEIMNWKHFLEVYLNILTISKGINKEAYCSDENIVRVTTIYPSDSSKSVKLEKTNKVVNFIIIVWNFSSLNKIKIMNTFKEMTTTCTIHTFEEHFEIEIWNGYSRDICTKIFNLKTVDRSIKVCVIEEKEFFDLTYKTMRCDGCCYGNQKKCSCFHSLEDERRIPMVDNLYKYDAIHCLRLDANFQNCPEDHRCTSCHNKIEFNFHPIKYQSSLCLDKEIDSCNNQPWCSFAHRCTPEMFYNVGWEDLVTFGQENSLKFIIGAIRGFNKPSLRKKKIVFISPSMNILNIVKSIILAMMKGSRIKLVLVGESPVDTANYDVFLGTLENIAYHNWNLMTRNDVQAMIVDNVLKIVGKSDTKLLLISILKKLKNDSAVNKVFVCETYDPSATKCLSTLFNIPLKEVEVPDVIKVRSSINVSNQISEVLKKMSDEELMSERSSQKQICSKLKRSTSRSVSNEREVEYPSRSRRKRSRSRKSVKENDKEISGSRSGTKKLSSKRKKTHSRSRGKSRKSRKRKSRSRSPSKRTYTKLRNQSSRSRSDKSLSSSPRNRSLSRTSSDEFHINSPRHEFLSKNQRKGSLSKSNSDTLHTKDQLIGPHSVSSNSGTLCIPTKLYECEPSTSQAVDVSKDEFSIERTIALLEHINPKLGKLTAAMKEIIRLAREYGVNSNRTLELIRNEDNTMLFNVVIDKLKNLLIYASPIETPIYSKAVIWILKLLDHAKNSVSKEIDINLNTIATATMLKGHEFTINLIKTAFAYEGKPNPSKVEINEVYLKICALHFEMTMKEN